MAWICHFHHFTRRSLLKWQFSDQLSGSMQGEVPLPGWLPFSAIVCVESAASAFRSSLGSCGFPKPEFDSEIRVCTIIITIAHVWI